MRLLDANVNRAREGLRVLEDLARFVLDDRGLARDAKQLRHALRSIAGDLGLDGLRAAAVRDTPGDVGTELKTQAEGERGSLGDVAAAAGKRAQEALRVLAEGAKVLPGAGSSRAAREAERLRYAAYELERALVARLGRGGAAGWRLCVLLTESLCRRPWKQVAEEAFDAGADAIQLREKDRSDRELLARARWLVSLARAARRRDGTRPAVIVNDRADLALLAGADGVHLGQDDLPVSAVRAMAGGRLVVGVSTHDLAEARRAWADGADYVGVGAMFPSATKRRATSGEAFLRAFLREARGKRPMPHLAIGGITAENVGELARAGCRGVAVSGAVCGAADPWAACRAILKALAGGAEAKGPARPARAAARRA